MADHNNVCRFDFLLIPLPVGDARQLRPAFANLALTVEVMAALSKHKYLDTTKSHYIEQKLNDMLEATYGIIIGDLDDCYSPSKHITEKIPEDVDRDENVVENGCGNCKSAQCTMRNALPCLICDNFITTIKHEPAFQRAIEAVDKLIQNSGTKHDKDDLTTIKLLLVMYLKAIYQKKQEATE